MKDGEDHKMIKQCLFCSKEFKTKPSHATRRKCCSRECISALKKKNRTKQCLVCEKDFDHKGFPDQKYCSKKCMGLDHRKPDRFCIRCKKLIEHKPSNLKYCSKECYTKSQEGSTPLNAFWSTANQEEKIKRLRESFEKHVIKQEGCWSWNGCPSKKYKALQYEGKIIGAHRASWILHKGQIPDGMYVCHTCDNPECTNPEHLFLGTPTDNVLDMHKKERAKVVRGEKIYGSKLISEQVIEIKKLLQNSNLTLKEIGNMFNVHTVTIYDIKHEKTWKHIEIPPDLN